MRKFPAILACLCAFGASAKCIQYPPLLTEIEVLSCQAFTVKPSTALISWELAEDEKIPIHNPGKNYSATLLSGIVKSAYYVSKKQDQHMAFKAEPYIPAGLGHFELSGEASLICPEKLPTTISVIGAPRCCDTLPSQGECISPFVSVKIEPNPSNWHKLKTAKDEG